MIALAPNATLRPLRPHQVTTLELLRESLRTGHACPMVQLPTGAGKTVLAAHIVAGLLARRKRVVFCVPRLGLIDQTAERFVENGIDPGSIGVIQGDHAWHRPHAPVQVASIQTVGRRGYPDTDAVIIDEAHELHEAHKAWIASTAAPQGSSVTGNLDLSAGVVASGTTDATRRLPRPFFVGLSATPWARGLGKHFDDLIRPISLGELIDAGHLSKFRVFAPSHPDLTGVKTVAGDYHEGQLGERMSQPVLVANIVDTWLAKGENRPTLCFAVNRAHAKALSDQFAAVGVSVAYVDCDTPREEREMIGRRFAVGAVKVVCNIGTLTTGIDWDVRCLILARPTKSQMLFCQIIGRGLRTADGKTECLILDHSDTHLRLGMVTDIDHDTLDDGTKQAAKGRDDEEREEPLPWECVGCHAVVPARIQTCCECGYTRKPASNVQQLDGDLTELTPGSRKPKKPSGSVAEQIAGMGKAEVYAQLLWFAEERGRSIGWAGHAYKEIFGVWPQGLSKRHAVETSSVVRSWIKAKDIRWAKSQQALLNREMAHA